MVEKVFILWDIDLDEEEIEHIKQHEKKLEILTRKDVKREDIWFSLEREGEVIRVFSKIERKIEKSEIDYNKDER